MFTGRIKSIGPRYCPSIEDKIYRFSDRERHQLFLEPEGYDSMEVYLNGFSTSLPESIQRRSVQSVVGLEKAEILRLGYAVEYDFFPPHQLNYCLESKKIKGLYLAGQVNGTSGYEEAAAQGLIAGINAALKIRNENTLKLSRTESYIGVLIDDLINKSTIEPYRMFTSRAEFRLLLRQDNADLRLFKYGKQFGLLSENECELIENKKREIEEIFLVVNKTNISNEIFNKHYGGISSKISRPEKMKKLIKRPGIQLQILLNMAQKYNYRQDAVQDVEFSIKYDGYIKRSNELINRFKQYETKKIPSEFDYSIIKALSAEAREKLNKIRPASFGQASRISGVSPADMSVLLVFLEKEKYKRSVSRET